MKKFLAIAMIIAGVFTVNNAMAQRPEGGQRPQQQTAAPAAGAGTPIQSPLAGKVVSLDVKPGTAVKEGDQVLTLEAMKMNAVIYAPADGTVTSFCVAPGDTVAENQPLAYLG